MMNKIVSFLLSAVLFFCFNGCSSDDDEYNANAESYYVASTLKKVTSITSTAVSNGQTYSFKYAFTYDAKNRISNIDGVINYPSTIGNCLLTTQATYYYTDMSNLKVTYSQSYAFADKPSSDYETSGEYFGTFNELGALEVFGALDCEYEMSRLSEVYLDYGEYYQLCWSKDNVVGYYYKESETSATEDFSTVNDFSSVVNNTNFDFSAFFGGLAFEVETLPCGGNILYSPFYLGAFDMLGARSHNLPAAQYTYNADGYPVTIVQTTSGGLTITRTVEYE